MGLKMEEGTMRYYIEERSKAIRGSFEKEVLGWKGVTTRKMFGCPCYMAKMAKGKMFAKLMTKKVVVTNLGERDMAEMVKKFRSRPSTANKRTIKHWLSTDAKTKTSLSKLMPFVKKSYQAALKK